METKQPNDRISDLQHKQSVQPGFTPDALVKDIVLQFPKSCGLFQVQTD